jgi:tetratricopeptide (TPR) repeat protein
MSRRLWALMAACLTLAGPEAIAQTSLSGLAKAAEHLRDREYVECIAAIDSWLARQSGSAPEPYILRGRCFAGRDDYRAATADYDHALALAPRNVQALYYRAVTSSQRGDMRAALADFSAAIALMPTFSAAYGGRAGAYRLIGDNAAAAIDLNRAVELDPRNPALRHVRGCLLYDTRNWDGALADFRQAIAIDPSGQALARARIWLIRARRDERRAADRELAGFLDGSTAAELDSWERAILLFLVGGRSEADLFRGVESVEPTVKAGRTVQANLYAGTVRLLAGDREGARRLFESGLETGRRSYAEYLSAAQGLRDLGSTP